MTTYLFHEEIGRLRTIELEARRADRFDFDDGYAVYRRAAALLARRGRGGTFYLVTRWLGLPGFLSWADVRAMAADGHELGNHTASHVWLGRVPLEARRLELREAQAAIADAIGRAPTRFAYPYGRIDPEAAATVAEFGFVSTRGIAGLQAVR